MKIAMLARNPNLYSHRRLQQAAEDRGHQFDILNTLRCTVHIASHKPEVFYNGEPCIGYDAVIPRIGASITNYGLAILRQFEMRGCWPLNESVAIGRSRDKLRSMQILAKHGLGLPLTAYANDPKAAEEIIKAVKGPPVVIKLLTARLRAALGAMEARMTGAYLLPEGFSAADIMFAYSFELGRYYVHLEEFPALMAYWARLQARPAYQRAKARDGEQDLYDRDFYPLPEG